MTRRAWSVAALLFGSGLCALVYQTAWLREFRLVFGASTEASAAVIAIFIGGLGLGGLWLGPRADRKLSPLGFYARLEALIALSAALTPALLLVVRQAYVALGGSATLGLGAGTLLRLLLAALVLALPTLLMGGTLPAAARAAETDEDTKRRAVALLYGVNTLGAVTGAFLSTFFLLEAFGTRTTLWLACLVNLLVSILARQLAREMAPAPAAAVPPPQAAEASVRAPAAFVLGAAALVGFAFFLMELVWYRMLGPLLGGTVFTFGLILSLALLGIGLGGAAYSLFGSDRPASLTGFAWTCLLEAAAIAIPFALGDRVAVLAQLLRPLGSLGFWGHVLAWTGVGSLVVVPVAFAAGVQFPLLIALLGRGREHVGRQIGLAYAWNTAGAIVGSLAGGFGLLPLLSAPDCWRLVAALLVALGLCAVGLALRAEGGFRLRLAPPVALAVAVAALLTAPGPTAAWRHSGVGAGRATLAVPTTPNGIRHWRNQERRVLEWEADGVESSVALQTRALGLAFSVNGKVDGHATGDAPTQIMSGLLGAILHGRPRAAMVVGLGTGSTAGWLGVVPGIERVDVVELERGILHVARECAPVNQDVLANPKVHVMIGDGREFLLTTPRRYDVIFSEPSNPYRAGIASLFTREYYRAAFDRLEPEGLFVQWMQAYEIDAHSVRRVYATLRSVFPVVETWRTDERNLLLIGARRPIAYSADALRERIAQEPHRQALLHAWRVVDLEGFLARFVAGPALADALAARPIELNTDDRNHVEFAFAQFVGRQGLFGVRELGQVSRALGAHRPPIEGAVDWARVADGRVRLDGGVAEAGEELDPGQLQRAAAWRAYVGGDAAGALESWRAQPREPIGPDEAGLLAETLAEHADEQALTAIETLRALEPVEADVALARLRLRQGRPEQAAAALEAAFEAHRRDPWPASRPLLRSFQMVREIAERDPRLAARLFEALRRPFAALALEEERTGTALDVALRLGAPACAEGLAALEPHVPWTHDLLRQRLQCYLAARRPEAAAAAADLAEYLRAEPSSLALELLGGMRP